MVRLSFSGQRLSFFEQPIWPGPFAHAFFGQCDLRVNCRPSALVGPERADCVILSIWKMPTRKSGVSILIQLQAVESENGQYDCFGRRSVACGTTRYGLIRRFFAVFSANGILRRLEVQPECRLSQRSPLRRPDMIILGYASSADNTTCSRPAPGRRTALSEQGLEYQDRESSATPSWLRPASELPGDPLTTRQRRFVPRAAHAPSARFLSPCFFPRSTQYITRSFLRISKQMQQRNSVHSVGLKSYGTWTARYRALQAAEVAGSA